MRKKALLNQINEVAERNNQLFQQCRELEDKISLKDKLIEQNSSIIEALYREKTELSELLDKKNDDFSDLKEKFEQYIAEASKNSVEDIYSQNSAEKETEETEEEFNCGDNSNEQNSAEKVNDTVLSQNTNPAEFLNCSGTSSVLKKEVLKLGSEAIGRIVLLCAELCNEFAASGRTNSKDLINLALGRTEVFKSEVLMLADEDMSDERLNAELNSREMAVKEYFELLKRQ